MVAVLRNPCLDVIQADVDESMSDQVLSYEISGYEILPRFPQTILHLLQCTPGYQVKVRALKEIRRHRSLS